MPPITSQFGNIASVQYSLVSPTHRGPTQVMIEGPGVLTTTMSVLVISEH